MTLDLTRFGAVIAVGVIALLACSGDDDGGESGAATVETETRSVDIGDGRTMFLECMGEGSPTVILESGIHDSSEYWTVSQLLAPAVDPPVMQGLATTNRVCRYDRPGTIVPGDPPAITDRSTPVAMPRTVGDSVTDLHALLEAADEGGPYVVVAHSWGGMIGQLYARTYPQDVAGLVLVDAFAPALRDLLGEKWAAYTRVLNDPPGETLNTLADYEKFDVDASIDQVRDAPTLPDIPLVVMSKTEPFPDFPADAGMTTADLEAVWPRAQDSLVQLRPNTPHEIATGSIHYIQVTEPDLVIAAARLVINRNTTNDGG
jgi:pimeloyl-ACP methyl ester carboxylesterase